MGLSFEGFRRFQCGQRGISVGCEAFRAQELHEVLISKEAFQAPDHREQLRMGVNGFQHHG